MPGSESLPCHRRYGRFSQAQISATDKLGRVRAGGKVDEDEDLALLTPWSVDTMWIVQLPRGQHVLVAQVELLGCWLVLVSLGPRPLLKLFVSIFGSACAARTTD